jgi:beta-glucosidase
MSVVPTYAQILLTQNLSNLKSTSFSSLTIEEKVAMCHAQSKFSSPGVERLGIPNYGCLTGRMEFAEKLMG